MTKQKLKSNTRRKEAEVSRLLAMLDYVPTDNSGFLPSDVTIRVDVSVSLKDAMTDLLPITRDSIGSQTVPNSIQGLGSDGWGICLARFESLLEIRRSVYAFYDHKPAYTLATYEMRFHDIINYLIDRILEQFAGDDQ